jgi:hypothetical protein
MRRPICTPIEARGMLNLHSASPHMSQGTLCRHVVGGGRNHRFNGSSRRPRQRFLTGAGVRKTLSAGRNCPVGKRTYPLIKNWTAHALVRFSTTTLGCGSWGGNSISENLDYKHLMNVRASAKSLPERRFRPTRRSGHRLIFTPEWTNKKWWPAYRTFV